MARVRNRPLPLHILGREGQGKWHEYAIDLSRYTFWGGMVNELWFEGVDLRHATVEIDWMRFEP